MGGVEIQIPSDLTAMNRLLLFVGLWIALAASISGESRQEDENSLEKTEFDLLDRNPRNADPKRRKNSSRNVKKQRQEKRKQRKKSLTRKEKKKKSKARKQKKNRKNRKSAQKKKKKRKTLKRNKKKDKRRQGKRSK